MNYLAHAYLSFNQPQILAGNMISDFIKGRKQFDYPVAIQKGILLHRGIDSFTDGHPVTQELKSYFRPKYRLYSGAFGDVVYDHFLATDHNEFPSQDSLKNFSNGVYSMLDKQLDLLPERFQQLFPYMKQHDWLYNYQFREGIRKSFEGLAKRAVYLEESVVAYEIFNQQYDALRSCYTEFFPQLKSFAAHQFNQLINS